MCNYTDAEESPVSLRGKGVLVVGVRLGAVRGVVEALEGEGAHVLVASAEACELTQVPAGGAGGASPHVVRGLVRGLTVDLGRRAEIVRVFRWVDGMLPRLDALVSVVEVGAGPGGEAADAAGCDVEGWRRAVDEQWLVPLGVALEASSRMRLRRRGLVLQIGVPAGGVGPEVVGRCGAGGGGGSSAFLGGESWRMLCAMLEARRGFFSEGGVRLTLLEAGLGDAPRVRCRGGAGEAVRAAVDFCLHAPGRLSVEFLRVRGGCG
jgi:NAD(P)-dependent dehydrogenase (short-subunit alcohol dehydrogenase family)